MLKKVAKARYNPVGFMRDSRFAPLSYIGRRLENYRLDRYADLGRHAKNTRIAVIMTAYKTGALLEKAAQSILAQSHENLELWIIDDASIGSLTSNRPKQYAQEKTCDIAADIARRDSRVKAFTSPINHGTYWSKNWCLARTKADIVAFHDSDDISLPNRLEIQLGALRYHRQALACTCRWNRFLEDGTSVQVDGEAARTAAISLMMKRKPILESIGYFDTVRISADSEYLARIRLIFGRKSMLHLRPVLYQGTLRDNSLTRGPGSGFDWQKTDGSLTREVTGDRKKYTLAYQKWHQSFGFKAKHYIDFPLKNRPFEAPAALLQNCNDSDMDQIYSLTDGF